MAEPDVVDPVGNPTPQLSVLIVNYNAGALLAECVAAVLNSSVRLQVLVGDNGSADDSLLAVRERFSGDPRVTLVEHHSNLGFARGNNRLLDLAKAPQVLFLNPDCIVLGDALGRVLAFMDETPEAGMAGCTIRDPDGGEQAGSRRVIPDPWIGLVRMFHLDRWWPGFARGKRLNLNDLPMPTRPTRVDAISGSFMWVRRTALEAVGPLDEGYFLHCEDLDWFVRFARAGWPIYLVPEAQVIHHKGGCSVGRLLWVEWFKHRGMVRFFRKFQFADYPFAFSLLVIAGIWVRFAVVAVGAGLTRILHASGFGRVVGS